MRLMRLSDATLLAAALALLIPACGQPQPDVDADSGEGVPGQVDGNGTPHVRGEQGSEPGQDPPVCLESGPFVADGTLAMDAGPEGNSSRIGGLRWHRYEGCERLVIDLEGPGGDAAGRVGEVKAEVIRELGVVRIRLPGVASVTPASTDARFEGPLARSAYAVISQDGRSVYVDLHLGAPAEAAVSTLHAPARVLVDLRPGGAPIPAPAPSSSRVVVLEPRPGPARYPLTVSGYARTFEANVVLRLERDGAAVHEDFTTATAWTEAWGHYSFAIPDGPDGPLVLHVGEHSARDGSWEGLAIDLRMR